MRAAIVLVMFAYAACVGGFVWLVVEGHPWMAALLLLVIPTSVKSVSEK